MTDKSESIYWANVWWILSADNLTFEEVMDDFRKKVSCRLISRGKSLGGIISCTEKNIY